MQGGKRKGRKCEGAKRKGVKWDSKNAHCSSSLLSEMAGRCATVHWLHGAVFPFDLTAKPYRIVDHSRSKWNGRGRTS